MGKTQRNLMLKKIAREKRLEDETTVERSKASLIRRESDEERAVKT
jgi:hypothetical protein